MRERKLRSPADSLTRLRGSGISCIIILYKKGKESKSERTMRICSSIKPTLKQQWNQLLWLVKKLVPGIAGPRLFQQWLIAELQVLLQPRSAFRFFHRGQTTAHRVLACHLAHSQQLGIDSVASQRADMRITPVPRQHR